MAPATLPTLSGAVTNPSGTRRSTLRRLGVLGDDVRHGTLARRSQCRPDRDLTVNLSEAVTVAGGTPTLTLNDGGIASYTSGSGSNALTFSYTVPAGQNTADLAVAAVNLGTATVTDGAGNAANLSGAVTNPAARCRSTPRRPCPR